MYLTSTTIIHLMTLAQIIFILKAVLTVHTELTVRKIVETVTTLVSAPILMEHAKLDVIKVIVETCAKYVSK